MAIKSKAQATGAEVVEPKNTLPVKMPVFDVKKRPSYEVEANFDEVETYLKGVAAKYANLVFTDENIEQAKVIKTELTALRTSLTKIQANVKSERFNNPKKIFDAKMDSLLSIIGSTESEIDEALSKEDQKRIDDINEALDAYKENFTTFYSLEDRYLSRIEYKKAYYNKTAIERESKADLEDQFKALKAEQTARNGAIKLIQKTLKDSPEINVQAQIDKLDGGLDVASILEWIETEQERLEALKAPKLVIGVPGSPEDSTEYLADEEEVADEEEAPVSLAGRVLEDAERISFQSDFPTKTKSLSITITYPIDAGDALTALFNMLKTHGITTKVNRG
jgi:DNA repair exonuclease SbcCD ATPase subunit